MKPTEDPRAASEAADDLGLSGRLAQQRRTRLMDRDGKFNVRRTGLSYWEGTNVYHVLLTISWPRFILLVFAAYLLVNVLFACAYFLCGPSAIASADAAGAHNRLINLFFFSVQTLATIGYGKMTPEGIAANLLVALEALVGLLGFALATGLLFARFSRPSAKIVFSRNAVVAPYKDGAGLMFRMVNGRSNELSELHIVVTMALFPPGGGPLSRKFFTLKLERDRVALFPTQWVVVHPIDEESPLHGMDPEQLKTADFEIFILLTATDETFSQIVNTRSSFGAEEVIWGAKFRDIHEIHEDGAVLIDASRLHEYDAVALPGW